MKDDRRSTATNDDEPDADALRLALGRRIRAARVAQGLSQQAVADAMAERGFSWRQTTVAKSESADRPTLFTEVVALSAILKRDLDYFLSGRNELDAVAESLRGRLENQRKNVEANEYSLASQRSHLASLEALDFMVSLLVEYTRNLDGGALKRGIATMLGRGALSLKSVEEALTSAGVPKAELARLDESAMREALTAEEGRAAVKSTLWEFDRGVNADALIEEFRLNLDAPWYVLDALRRTPVYQRAVAHRLLNAIIEYVDGRPDRS